MAANCRKCSSEINECDVEIIDIVPDVESIGGMALDIIIECPSCGHKLNNFVSIDDFMDLGEEE